MSDGITEARRGTYFSENEIQHNKEYYDVNRNRSKRDRNLIPEINHMPNQKWHKIVSFIKSGTRIIGYALLPFSLVSATIVLILSEIIGIIEELV
tara:strand:- start:2740 stop:3024 length:285 start_codon:yes stop_codon:yes gene_type:complete